LAGTFLVQAHEYLKNCEKPSIKEKLAGR